MHAYIVIGSGPAGVITTHRLLEAGHHVLMIDSGIESDVGHAITQDHFLNQLSPENVIFYAPTEKANNTAPNSRILLSYF